MTDDAVQTSRLTDEAIEDARSRIGLWLRRDVHAPARYEPVSLHDIRRWAWYSVGDDNPLWSDADYARGTVWGVTIAPPTFLYTIDSTIVAPGLRGVQWIFAGSRWTHERPVKVGDTITARARLIDVQVREGRSVPRFVNQVGEVLFENQRGERVARCETDIFRVPRKRSGQGIRRDERTPYARPRYTREAIDRVAAEYRAEARRGAEPRYWEEVEVGEALPAIAKGPLTLVDIVGFYAGRRTVYPVLKMAFADRERHPANVYVSPETGIPMHPAAGHYDAEIAREVGMPDAYDQGWMRLNWGAHLITNWAGDLGVVRRYAGRLPKPNLIGNLTRLEGRVTGKAKVEGEPLVDLEWWGTDQTGTRNCEGTATVRLPSRETGSQW